jgi:hypothetical protein
MGDGENPSDAIGPTLTLSMWCLKANKLANMESGLHGTLLKAGAGSTQHPDPET